MNDILQGRIQFQYKTYSEWVEFLIENPNYIPLKSEICIVDAQKEDTIRPEILSLPLSFKFGRIMLKIGDGTSKMNSLKWVSGNLGPVEFDVDRLKERFVIGEQGDKLNEIFNIGTGITYYAPKATGERSHAEGYGTYAAGLASHAEGYGNTTNNYGAQGDYSHSEGQFTKAAGSASHAEGHLAKASGKYSHAEGYLTEAVGEASHAEGSHNTVYSESGHVQGRYAKNDEDQNYASQIGNGTSAQRSDAYHIDWNGNSEQPGSVQAKNFYYTDGTQVQKELCYTTYKDDNTIITSNGDPQNKLDVESLLDCPKFSTTSNHTLGDEFSDIYTTISISVKNNDTEGKETPLQEFQLKKDKQGLYFGEDHWKNFLSSSNTYEDRQYLLKEYFNGGGTLETPIEERDAKFSPQIIGRITKASYNNYYTLQIQYNANYLPPSSNGFITITVKYGEYTKEIQQSLSIPFQKPIVFQLEESPTTNKGGTNQKYEIGFTKTSGVVNIYKDKEPQEINTLGTTTLILGNAGLLEGLLDKMFTIEDIALDFSSIQYKDSKEPFVIIYSPSSYGILLFDEKLINRSSTTPYTYSLQNFYIKRTGIAKQTFTIPEKYLPLIAKETPDMLANPGEPGYIENRLCYATEFTEETDNPLFINNAQFTLSPESGDIQKTAEINYSLLSEPELETLYSVYFKLEEEEKVYVLQQLKHIPAFDVFYFGNPYLLSGALMVTIAIVIIYKSIEVAVLEYEYKKGQATAQEVAEAKQELQELENNAKSLSSLVQMDTGEDYAILLQGEEAIIIFKDLFLEAEINCSVTIEKSAKPNEESIKTIDEKWLPKNALVGHYDNTEDQGSGELFNLALEASGEYSHAEGYGTIAKGAAQHVEGTYNIPDEEGSFIHIAGNGDYNLVTVSEEEAVKIPNQLWNGERGSMDYEDDTALYHYIGFDLPFNYFKEEGDIQFKSSVEEDGWISVDNCTKAEDFNGYIFSSATNGDYAFELIWRTCWSATAEQGLYLKKYKNKTVYPTQIRCYNYLIEKENRSNAYTLDWEGNGVYSGAVTATDFIYADSEATIENQGNKITTNSTVIPSDDTYFSALQTQRLINNVIDIVEDNRVSNYDPTLTNETKYYTALAINDYIAKRLNGVNESQGSNNFSGGLGSIASGTNGNAIAYGKNAGAFGEGSSAFNFSKAYGKGSFAQGGSADEAFNLVELTKVDTGQLYMIVGRYNELFAQLKIEDDPLLNCLVLIDGNVYEVDFDSIRYDSDNNITTFLFKDATQPKTGTFNAYLINPNYLNAIGDFSHAEGNQTKSVGESSHSEGSLTEAIGSCSHAEGFKTLSKSQAHSEGVESQALGLASHAEGNQSTANGDASHAEGVYTETLGVASHTEGVYSKAIGYYSHSEGNSTLAIGESSHSENSGVAIGDNSHAEGSVINLIFTGASQSDLQNTQAQLSFETQLPASLAINDKIVNMRSGIIYNIYYINFSQNKINVTHIDDEQEILISEEFNINDLFTTYGAFGDNSHTEGLGNLSVGNCSHAEGAFTEARGENSHAEGESAKAIAKGAHAQNIGTIASAIAQTAIGQYNVEDNEQLFIVGNGLPNDRKNIFTISTTGAVVMTDNLIANITDANGITTTHKLSDKINPQYLNDNRSSYLYKFALSQDEFKVTVSNSTDVKVNFKLDLITYDLSQKDDKYKRLFQNLPDWFVTNQLNGDQSFGLDVFKTNVTINGLSNNICNILDFQNITKIPQICLHYIENPVENYTAAYIGFEYMFKADSAETATAKAEELSTLLSSIDVIEFEIRKTYDTIMSLRIEE